VLGRGLAQPPPLPTFELAQCTVEVLRTNR
jgi:hypothetical protein